MFIGRVMSRADGFFFTLMYLAYLVYLFLIHSNNAYIPSFYEIALVFFVPASFFIVLALFSLKKRKKN
jgi:FtsH-binding integral membrane protein